MKKLPITKLLLSATAAGQADQPIYLQTNPLPVKEHKRLLRKLDASENWQRDGNTVYHATSVPLSIIASWQGNFKITLQAQAHHFRLLALDAAENRDLYAIPVSKLDSISELPQSGLSKVEIFLLTRMANEISANDGLKETTIFYKHPAQPDIRSQRKIWSGTHDEERYLALLKEQPWILPVVTGALDSQLHAFKRFGEAPVSIYNFITDPRNPQADSIFFAALTAVNFSSAAQHSDAAPVEIYLRDSSDLKTWRLCVERLALIRTATGSLLTPLLDELSERERVKYCGGILPPPPPTIPIMRCRSFLHRRGVLDVELPRDLTSLTILEQDTLRAMASNTLTKADAQDVYDAWRERMSRRDAYRIDPFACWRQVLEYKFIYSNFHNPESLDLAIELLGDVTEKQCDEEEKREGIIKAAVEYIADTNRYEREITERPATCEDARRILEDNEDAVAFWFTPGKGSDAGKRLLAFSRKSLIRMIARVGGGENILEAVLDRCERQGFFDKKKRPITLGGSTFNAITFLAT